MYAWRCQECGTAGLFYDPRPTTEPLAYAEAALLHRATSPLCEGTTEWREATEEDESTIEPIRPFDHEQPVEHQYEGDRRGHARCACPSPDEYVCIQIRYNVDETDEPCECGCHESDDDE